MPHTWYHLIKLPLQVAGFGPVKVEPVKHQVLFGLFLFAPLNGVPVVTVDCTKDHCVTPTESGGRVNALDLRKTFVQIFREQEQPVEPESYETSYTTPILAAAGIVLSCVALRYLYK